MYIHETTHKSSLIYFYLSSHLIRNVLRFQKQNNPQAILMQLLCSHCCLLFYPFCKDDDVNATLCAIYISSVNCIRDLLWYSCRVRTNLRRSIIHYKRNHKKLNRIDVMLGDSISYIFIAPHKFSNIKL